MGIVRHEFDMEDKEWGYTFSFLMEYDLDTQFGADADGNRGTVLRSALHLKMLKGPAAILDSVYNSNLKRAVAIAKDLMHSGVAEGK